MSYFITVSRLTKVVAIIRDVKETMPMQMFAIYLAIVEKPGITAAELVKVSGTSQPAVFRHTRALSKGDPEGSGFDLVEATVNPFNTKQMQYYLTPKGRDLAASLLLAMDPQVELAALHANRVR